MPVLDAVPDTQSCSLSVRKPSLDMTWWRVSLWKMLERHLGAKQTQSCCSHLGSDTKRNPRGHLHLVTVSPTPRNPSSAAPLPGQQRASWGHWTYDQNQEPGKRLHRESPDPSSCSTPELKGLKLRF